MIDASRIEQLTEVNDIDLSRDEDSVTSLAIARSNRSSVTAFAGINSSRKEQEQGTNEHLRSFKLTYPSIKSNGAATKSPKKKSTSEKPAPAPQALGKVGLFDRALGVSDTYQRVLRFSPAKNGSSKLGAVATGLAPSGEIVVFDASKDSPSSADVKQRIKLQKAEEAADLDILARDDGDFELAYCTDYDVCVSKVSTRGKGKTFQPICIYTTPHPTTSKAPKRAAFRSLRWLTPRLLVLVQNLPKRTGTEVLLLDVPEDRARGGAIILRKRFHKTANSATSLAVTTLPAASVKQNVQHIVAIAGQDISLTILTLDHHPFSNSSLKFKTFAVLKNVHPVQMTSLAFSTFEQPKDAEKAAPQSLKLASTSMGSTVYVHRLSLIPYPPFSKEPARYVLSSPAGRSELRQIGGSVLITLIMVALAGVLIQAMAEIRGGSPEYLGAKKWLSQSLREKIAVPYMFGEAPVIPSSMPAAESVKVKAASAYDAASSVVALPQALQYLLQGKTSPKKAGKALIVRDDETGLSAEVHHDEEVVKQHGRKWEDLEHHERQAWKKRIAQAGEWVEDELEAVLKGVFFGELAGAVAGAVHG